MRPHPHIGLGTVTYRYDGEFEHRDSIGTHQMIYPGEVNWMTAGRGVTHSERTSDETRAKRNKLFGIQTWIGRNLVCLGKETTQFRLVLHKVIGVEPRVGRHGFSSFFTLGGMGQR